MNRFKATLNKYDFGKYFYTVVYFPQSVLDTLPLELYPRLRVEAELDGVFVEDALMPDRVGSAQTRHLLGASALEREWREGQRVWYLTVSKQVLKSIARHWATRLRSNLTLPTKMRWTSPGRLRNCWVRTVGCSKSGTRSALAKNVDWSILSKRLKPQQPVPSGSSHWKFCCSSCDIAFPVNTQLKSGCFGERAGGLAG